MELIQAEPAIPRCPNVSYQHKLVKSAREWDTECARRETIRGPC